MTDTAHGADTPDRGQRLLQSGERALMREDWPVARDAFQAVVELDPDSAAGLLGLARALVELREHAQAEEVLNRIFRLTPGEPDATNLYGLIALAKGDTERAVALFLDVVKQRPDHAVAYNNIGHALQVDGWLTQAVWYYRKALELDPDLSVAHLNLGNALLPVNQEKEALHHLRIALQLRPGEPHALSAMAGYLRRRGEGAEAERLLRPVIERRTEHASLAFEWAELMHQMKRPSEAIPLLEGRLQSQATSQHEKRICHFMLAKLQDAAGDYDRAFQHLQAGHKLKGTRFDPQRWRVDCERLMTAFDHSTMAKLPRSGLGSELPVFIVGMFRSGTSLVEQVLASHSAVKPCGELNHIGKMAVSLNSRTDQSRPYPECVDALDKPTVDAMALEYLQRVKPGEPRILRTTDKMPGNFLHIGLIELLFPQARVIHCVRDPLDTCLSCYFQDFAEQQMNPSELEDWALYYRGYREIMAHWNKIVRIPVLDIHYEELVARPERTVRRLLEFCGLPWEEACLEPHRSSRFVATASHSQVRRPFHTDSVGRHHRYAKFLGPLKAGFDTAATQ